MKQILQRTLSVFLVCLVFLTLYDVLRPVPGETSPVDSRLIMLRIAEIDKKLGKLELLKPQAEPLILIKQSEIALEYIKGGIIWVDKAKISRLEREIKGLQAIPNEIERLEEERSKLNNKLSKAIALDKSKPWYEPLLALGGVIYARIWDAVDYTLYFIAGLLGFKMFSYFCIAPFVGKFKSVAPADGGTVSGNGQPGDEGQTGDKALTVHIPPSHSITIIGEEYIQGHKAQPNVKVDKRTRWLMDWSCPFMCLVCKLCFMTQFNNLSESRGDLELNITSNNPDEYFSRINIKPGQQYFIKPSDLVAFGSGIKISPRWRLFHLAAWCMGQVRFFTLSGSGQVVVRAIGGLTKGCVASGTEVVERKHSLICASQGIRLHVKRNQTFWPFMTGEANLFDLKLIGHGTYHTCNVVTGGSTASEKLIQAILKAIGQLLGF